MSARNVISKIATRFIDVPVSGSETKKSRAWEFDIGHDVIEDHFHARPSASSHSVHSYSLASSNAATVSFTVTADKSISEIHAGCSCQEFQSMKTAAATAGIDGVPACEHLWTLLKAMDVHKDILEFPDLGDMEVTATAPKYSFLGDKIVRQVEKWGKLKTNLYLIGPRGTGKTLLATEFGEANGLEIFQISGTKGISDLDLLGRDKLDVDPKTGTQISQFVDGVLTSAFKAARSGRNVLVICDELTRIPVEHQNIFLKAFDTDKNGFRVLENHITPNQEDKLIRVPKSSLMAIATSNVGYAGIDGQEEALIDRFGATLRVPYLPRASEIDLVAERGNFQKTLAAKLVDFAIATRKMAKNGDVKEGLSTRALCMVAEFLNDNGISDENLADALEPQLFKCLDLTSPDYEETLDGLTQALLAAFPSCRGYLSRTASVPDTAKKATVEWMPTSEKRIPSAQLDELTRRLAETKDAARQTRFGTRRASSRF